MLDRRRVLHRCIVRQDLVENGWFDTGVNAGHRHVTTVRINR